MRREMTFWGMLIILFLFWVAVSGTLHWQSLIFGLGASYMITYFNRELLISSRERPIFTVPNLKRMVNLFGIFISAVMKANVQVAMIVLNPKLPIAPTMVTFKKDLRTETSRVVLGNAITLTPGTLTVMCTEAQEFTVHALTEQNAREVQEWVLIDKLEELDKTEA